VAIWYGSFGSPVPPPYWAVATEATIRTRAIATLPQNEIAALRSQ